MVQPIDWEYYSDSKFRNKLANTLKPEQIKAEDYQVVYYAGGHGTVFDFFDNKKLHEISRTIY